MLIFLFVSFERGYEIWKKVIWFASFEIGSFFCSVLNAARSTAFVGVRGMYIFRKELVTNIYECKKGYRRREKERKEERKGDDSF